MCPDIQDGWREQKQLKNMAQWGLSCGVSEALTVAQKANGFPLLFVVKSSFDRTTLLAALGPLHAKQVVVKGAAAPTPTDQSSPPVPRVALRHLSSRQSSFLCSPYLRTSLYMELLRTQIPAQFFLALNC